MRLYAENYRYVGDFKEGFAAVYDENGHSFHIDCKGLPAYPKRFLEVGQFHKGIATARDITGTFHIDPTGNPVYSYRFSEIEPFYNGRAKVKEIGGNLSIIDEKGKVLDRISLID